MCEKCAKKCEQVCKKKSMKQGMNKRGSADSRNKGESPRTGGVRYLGGESLSADSLVLCISTPQGGAVLRWSTACAQHQVRNSTNKCENVGFATDKKNPEIARLLTSTIPGD